MVLFFYGSHPKISLLELQTVSELPITGGQFSAQVELEDSAAVRIFNELGGFPRAANILASFEENDKPGILKKITEYFTQKAVKRYVISVFGADRVLSPIEVMKELKNSGIKSKFTGKLHERYASPASVFYLLRKGGVELCLVRENKKVFLCETIAVQDPNYWSLIDFERPHRDQHIGMLPSKLARIMVNLSKVKPGNSIWDPFVGQGTVIMQAALKQIGTIGTDKNPTAIQYTKENVKWLLEKGLVPKVTADIFEWDFMSRDTEQFKEHEISSIVTETYLGAMRSFPFKNREEASKIWQKDVQSLLSHLIEISEVVLKRGQRLVFIKPIYKYIDNKTVKWYNPDIRFNRSIWQRIQVSETFEDNIWTQKDSIIGREIVVLEKIGIK